jgi:predicted anti-sigma-YlaC factor YlaD
MTDALSMFRALCLVSCLGAAGCGTVRQAALNSATDLFAGEEALQVFLSDDDPELVGDAIPFAIKTYEILLRQDPKDAELNLATGRLCIQYAYGWLQQEADQIEEEDYRRARQVGDRAAALFRRGRDYVLRGLELRNPGFAAALESDAGTALAAMTAGEVPFLYWLGAGWGGGIAAQKGNMDQVADLPKVEALMRRVLELDPTFDGGAAHEFFITYLGGNAESMGGDPGLALAHFEAAVEASGGLRASPYVALAESMAVARQDSVRFRELLNQALAVDPNVDPDARLANIISRKRAQWLLGQTAELFVDFEEGAP